MPSDSDSHTMNDPLIELKANHDRNVFVMMRYRDEARFHTLERSIRQTLTCFGLIPRFDKDRALSGTLWMNIELYIRHSRFGIAVIEQFDKVGFNANVAFELGYMSALGKPCLLLKEQGVEALFADLGGQLFKPFCAGDNKDDKTLRNSVQTAVAAWCRDDLDLPEADWGKVDETSWEKIVVKDPWFHTWIPCSSLGNAHRNVAVVMGESSPAASVPTLEIAAFGTESAGTNKFLKTLHGRVTFEYRVAPTEVSRQNICFCVIPMRKDEKGKDLIELTGEYQGDQRVLRRGRRIARWVPKEHMTDGEWHRGAVAFDFSRYKGEGAHHCIFGIRINEGSEMTGAASISIRSPHFERFDTLR